MKRYLLVGNPTARSGKGLALLDKILATLREMQIDITLLTTAPEGKTPGLVRDAVNAGDVDVVIYAGGDGTFAEVAKGLLMADRLVPMGMMPGGTANDQGQSFGLHSGLKAVEQNVAVLLENHVVEMDVGTITRVDVDGTERETDLWFDNMGFGFAAAVLARRNRDREVVEKVPVLRNLYRDQAVYAGAAVGEALARFVEPQRFDAEMKIDGEVVKLHGLTDIVVNNTPVFGGEWVPVPSATATDGMLDVVAMQGQQQLIGALITEHKQALAWDLSGVVLPTWMARRIDAILLQPRGGDVPCQIDGEEWHSGTRFRIGVRPGALPLIVPPGFIGPWARPDRSGV